MTFPSISDPAAIKLNQMSFPDPPDELFIKPIWFSYRNSCKEGPGIYTEFHKHTFFEIHFVLEGQITYSGESQSYSLCQNEALLFPPGISHRYEKKDQDFIKCTLSFRTAEESTLAKALWKEGARAFSINHDILSALMRILKEAEDEKNSSPLLMYFEITTLVYEVIKRLHINIPYSQSSSAKTDPRFFAAKQYIDDHIIHPITCDSVARECALSIKQLTRIFEKETHQSLHDYIINEKLHRAEELLLNTDFSIKQISGFLGFDNEYYFSSFFKRHCGMPPGVFRKDNRSDRD